MIEELQQEIAKLKQKLENAQAQVISLFGEVDAAHQEIDDFIQNEYGSTEHDEEECDYEDSYEPCECGAVAIMTEMMNGNCTQCGDFRPALKLTNK